MTTFAYCRVSTLDQDTKVQEREIKKKYPKAVIRSEKKSGTTQEGREVLSVLLEMISKGDKLVVYKLDRLARNMLDLLNIVQTLEDKKASLIILDQNIDTSTAAGKAFLQMLGVFAEFETNLRKERQAAGIAKAKAEGKYKGRKPVDQDKLDKIKELVKLGVPKTKIAKQVGLGVSTLYKYL